MTTLKQAIERRNRVEIAINVLKEVQKHRRPLSRVQRAALTTVIALLKVVYQERDNEVQTEKLYDPTYWS